MFCLFHFYPFTYVQRLPTKYVTRRLNGQITFNLLTFVGIWYCKDSCATLARLLYLSKEKGGREGLLDYLSSSPHLHMHFKLQNLTVGGREKLLDYFSSFPNLHMHFKLKILTVEIHKSFRLVIMLLLDSTPWLRSRNHSINYCSSLLVFPFC